MTCEICGTEFGGRAGSRFCSARCRKANSRQVSNGVAPEVVLTPVPAAFAGRFGEHSGHKIFPHDHPGRSCSGRFFCESCRPAFRDGSKGHYPGTWFSAPGCS